MIAQGTEAKDVTPEQIQAVASDVETFRRANKLTNKQIAKSTGYSESVISEFISGKYAGNSAQVAIDLEDWLVGEEERLKKQQVTTFVWTNVAMQIRSVASYCLDFRKVGMIYGPDTSGLGKTTALQAIFQDLGPRRATLVTIDKCDANPTGLLRKISQAMHIDDKGSSAQRFGRIVEQCKGRSHLLMIDQIHNLRGSKDDKPFYYLMDLYDQTQSAQLWCGTSDLVAYLKRQQARTLDEPLAQIRRRIFPCVDLMESMTSGGDGGERLYTVQNVREMFSRFKLRLTPAACRWLCALAHEPGSGALGTVVQIVEYATMLAQMRQLPSIDVPLLKESMCCGLTTVRAEPLVRDVDEHVTRIAKIG